MSLKNQRVLVGVTGSIAAYKTCDLVQRLKEKGAEVRVVMTSSATRLVHPNTFAALTGYPVFTDPWANASLGAMSHIDNARWATAFVIAPCTANTLAELALGLTGSALSMTALAYQGPLAIAPAMNTVMLNSAPVQEHLQTLSKRGCHILSTASGALACGELGEGKLISPEEIAACVDLILAFGKTFPDLSGIKVLISGGHTEEDLDGVRFLSNRSSGKTSLAVARAFQLSGAKVHLVLGLASETPPAGIQLTRVRTSAEFHRAMLMDGNQSDVTVMAAAIADFIPASADTGKWKDSRAIKKIELQPTKNILNELGKTKSKKQILVGFALETENPVAYAWEKLKARKCDFMVVNNPLAKLGLGFGEDQVAAAILSAGKTPKGSEPLAVMEKQDLAVDLVRLVAAKLKRESGAKK